jgi:hypothetical protein
MTKESTLFLQKGGFSRSNTPWKQSSLVPLQWGLKTEIQGDRASIEMCWNIDWLFRYSVQNVG